MEDASRPLGLLAIAPQSQLSQLRSYAAHLFLYGVLASLVLANVWGWKSDYRLRWALAAIVFAAVYGILDEYHQSFVLGRFSSGVDVIVNTVGAVVAALGLWLITIKWRGACRSRFDDFLHRKVTPKPAP